MEVEARHLQAVGVRDPWSLLTISCQALVLTPYHAEVNRFRERVRELHLDGRHGSCGIGIGEAVEDASRGMPWAIRFEDLLDRTVLARKLHKLLVAKQEVLEELGAYAQVAMRHTLDVPHLADWDPGVVANRYHEVACRINVTKSTLHDLHQAGTVVFEGAQGVLLDQDVGFHPHTTWSDCTSWNAVAMIMGSLNPVTTEIVGVVRAYATRHGAGPFPTRDQELEAALPDPRNGGGPQGDFRVGWFDAVATRYALRACEQVYQGKVDYLAITNLDRLDDLPFDRFPTLRVCDRYRHPRGGVVSDFSPGIDLAAQERTTRELASVAPVYLEYDRSQCINMSQIIPDLVGVPARIHSWGPTYTDKDFFTS